MAKTPAIEETPASHAPAWERLCADMAARIDALETEIAQLKTHAHSDHHLMLGAKELAAIGEGLAEVIDGRVLAIIAANLKHSGQPVRPDEG